MRTAHAIHSAPVIDIEAHCRQFCFFCIDADVSASESVIETWELFLKCVLSEKGPFNSARLNKKLPKLLREAADLAYLSGLNNFTLGQVGV